MLGKDAAGSKPKALKRLDSTTVDCCVVAEGYDIPPFASMSDFKVWENVEPPKGTVYNYILRPHHHSTAHIAAWPAPPDIGVQIYNRGTISTMFSKLQSGQSIPQVIAWAKAELEGFVR